MISNGVGGSAGARRARRFALHVVSKAFQGTGALGEDLIDKKEPVMLRTRGNIPRGFGGRSSLIAGGRRRREGVPGVWAVRDGVAQKRAK